MDGEPTMQYRVSNPPVRELRDLDAGYPRGLLDLRDRPPALYVAGSIEPRDWYAAAIVGSRRAASADLDHAFALARELASVGVTVISGLALGVDAAAHRGAMVFEGGRTIAAVATGLDVTFPPENRDLDMQIRRRGAVISAYPPGTGPARERFLARNEIVAAMTLVTVVVTSDEFSGTRNTIGHAIGLHRPVVFWAPTMGRQLWARRFASQAGARFVDDASGILQLMGDRTWTPSRSGA